MKKNKILLVIAIVFTLLMIFLAYDMSSRTVKPWNRKKEKVWKKY